MTAAGAAIDLHCHVLAGIDDGAPDIEQSVALAKAAAASGTGRLVATPHVNWRYPNRAGEISAAVDALNLRLEAEGVEIAVTAGAEIAMTAIGDIPSDEVPRLSLGNGPWLLIEPPFGPVATGIAELVADLARRGLRTVIAHPERCPAFHRDPALLGELIRLGSITSITAGSLVGQFGARPQSFALSLVRDELVHNVASDFHDVKARPPGLSRHLAEAGLAELEPWLTQEVPAAILDGLERLPPRPAVHLAPPRKSRSLLHPRRR